MICTACPYLAIMLLAAGIFPTPERGGGWRSLLESATRLHDPAPI